MLSILIPTYNYNVFSLVEEVYQQCITENIRFEIIVLDDASKNYHKENNQINTLNNCSYSILNQNIGRSAIRNLLATKASFKNLLFLDADVRTINNKFINTYVNFITQNSNYNVVYGGIVYQENKPEDNQLLRWIYGNKREVKSATFRKSEPYNNFSSANFLIKKTIISKIKFNESIKNYGYEDTLFAYDLKKINQKIDHLDNPVLHLGLETNNVFLKKSLIGVENAFYLKKEKLIDLSYVKILNFYNNLDKTKWLFKPILFIGKHAEPLILKNLLSKNPSLRLLDFYKLYYLIKLEQNE